MPYTPDCVYSFDGNRYDGEIKFETETTIVIPTYTDHVNKNGRCYPMPTLDKDQAKKTEIQKFKARSGFEEKYNGLFSMGWHTAQPRT